MTLEMTLEEYITDSIEVVRRRRRAAEAAEAARQAEYDALLGSVITSAVGILSRSIPAALLPYVEFIDSRPHESDLHAWPDSWAPREFLIRAPGLHRITFRTDGFGENLRAVKLVVDMHSYDDWPDAVVAAAELFQWHRQQELT